MSLTRLENVDLERTARPIKGLTGTSPAALNLTTSYQQVGTDYDLGNSPFLSAILKWIYSAGTTLSVRFKVSHDQTNWQWLPDVGTPTSGVSAMTIATLTFATSVWDVDGVYALCPLMARLNEFRYFQIWVKSNDASGSIAATSTILAGSGS